MADRHNGRAGAGKAPPALDHGIVITGDLRVQLLGVNLLPVKVRLLISSTELAQSLGLGWWKGAARARKADDPPKRDSNANAPSRAAAAATRTRPRARTRRARSRPEA